ncbi:hypothetical protein CPAR01_02189 [Colletotrichum paranaense]|uniref:Uncharacterized protein n=1 Tax=Colletotrichum paranaense TaxID=1914294 RepID=A0ABQ9T054_9PEZI|nr:uncharacterized protein CPAR01_02189 [Colletotrichum paranaense]KAK1544687.1 hypothetical protein CPAR01_02189 [Colletotrichum paranaense]
MTLVHEVPCRRYIDGCSRRSGITCRCSLSVFNASHSFARSLVAQISDLNPLFQNSSSTNMKFPLVPVAIALFSTAYAAPGAPAAENVELVARGNCPAAQDCTCTAKFDKYANPIEYGSTVSARISGADRGLTTSDWRGTNGYGSSSLCRVTVDRVCGNCRAWKTTTDKCGYYSLSDFSCVNA